MKKRVKRNQEKHPPSTSPQTSRDDEERKKKTTEDGGENIPPSPVKKDMESIPGNKPRVLSITSVDSDAPLTPDSPQVDIEMHKPPPYVHATQHDVENLSIGELPNSVVPSIMDKQQDEKKE